MPISLCLRHQHPNSIRLYDSKNIGWSRNLNKLENPPMKKFISFCCSVLDRYHTDTTPYKHLTSDNSITITTVTTGVSASPHMDTGSRLSTKLFIRRAVSHRHQAQFHPPAPGLSRFSSPSFSVSFSPAVRHRAPGRPLEWPSLRRLPPRGRRRSGRGRAPHALCRSANRRERGRGRALPPARHPLSRSANRRAPPRISGQPPHRSN
jgi:hypothetical protein